MTARIHNGIVSISFYTVTIIVSTLSQPEPDESRHYHIQMWPCHQGRKIRWWKNLISLYIQIVKLTPLPHRLVWQPLDGAKLCGEHSPWIVLIFVVSFTGGLQKLCSFFFICLDFFFFIYTAFLPKSSISKSGLRRDGCITPSLFLSRCTHHSGTG